MGWAERVKGEADVATGERWLTLGAVLVLGTFTVMPELLGNREHEGWAWSAGLGALAVTSLAWHRDHLLVVAPVIAGLGVLAVAMAPGTSLGVFAAGLIVVYMVAARAPARIVTVVVVIGLLLAGAMGARGALWQGRTWGEAAVLGLLTALLVGTAWLLGRLRSARVQEVEAMRVRLRHAEVERAQAAQIAALTERTRIARDMHDVVAHAVSGMVALADGGRYAARNDPAAGVAALEAISAGGRETLAELRQVIDALRDPHGRRVGPLPGLDRIEELVASARTSGLTVGYAVRGTPRAVPTAVGVAAYRIVQEALTNVVKHAGLSATADVLLSWPDGRAGALLIEVTDDGRGLAASRIDLGEGGAGLIGMRERTESLGGRLEVGPDARGGFRVAAALPVPAAPLLTAPTADPTSVSSSGAVSTSSELS